MALLCARKHFFLLFPEKLHIKTGLQKFILCRPVNNHYMQYANQALLRKRDYRLHPTLSFCLRD